MVASMSVEEKITWLRWRERLWWLMLLLVVVGVGGGVITEILFGKWLLISLLILFLLIALTVWLGRRVDSEISLIFSQIKSCFFYMNAVRFPTSQSTRRGW